MAALDIIITLLVVIVTALQIWVSRLKSNKDERAEKIASKNDTTFSDGMERAENNTSWIDSLVTVLLLITVALLIFNLAGEVSWFEGGPSR